VEWSRFQIDTTNRPQNFQELRSGQNNTRNQKKKDKKREVLHEDLICCLEVFQKKKRDSGICSFFFDFKNTNILVVRVLLGNILTFGFFNFNLYF